MARTSMRVTGGAPSIRPVLLPARRADRGPSPPATLVGPPMPDPLASPSASRLTAWLDRWGGILPLLVAEFVVWLGFGGLLPVLPLYFTEQGIDLATLGLVIAAWPAARLVSEPIFGWLADRTARDAADGHRARRDRPLRGAAAGLDRAAGVHPPARGVGLGAAIYDPAARGFLTDATPTERRGEAFGLYGAAQMGGLLLGPSIGAFGVDRFGGIGFVFVFSAVDLGHRRGRHRRAGARGARRATAAPDAVARPDGVPAGLPVPRGPLRPRPADDEAVAAADRRSAPMRLLNRGLHRRDRAQRRRLLRERHVRGHLEPVPDGPRARTSPSSG